MTLEELRTELTAILDLEEQCPTDWKEVEARCLYVIGRLNTEPEASYLYEVVYQFLDDPDVRQKAPSYAAGQRERLRRWLDAF